MTRARILTFIALVALPIIFLVGVGSYHLWTTGWAFWAWWPMGLSLALAYFLAWRWQKQIRAKQREEPPPLHWTDRDRQAWQGVEARFKDVDKIPDNQFGDPQFYFDAARQMAEEMARVYRPDAKDPIGIVTVPEILTVIELASHDLNELAHTYVPGSHLMTVDHWRTARKAVDWYRSASNVYWLASAVLDPIKTATRYAAAKYGMGKPLEAFQQNVILWFYSAYVRKVGFYLIELYSSRLRVGAERYRELMSAHVHESDPPLTASEREAKGERFAAAAEEPLTPDRSPRSGERGAIVRVVFIGQVKAGKSSLINALLGERKAATDVLPLTSEVTRYQLLSPGIPTRLELLDTAGYGRGGPDGDNIEDTANAVQESDLLLLVTHARNPARKADVDFYARLRQWFRERPQLRFPPVIVALTHVDLLPPAMEWSPPYDWPTGNRPKERSMADAIATARESFPDASGLVPCCSAAGKEWGVNEELLPEIVALLGEAKAVALLRCLHAEADEGKVKKVFAQLWAAGRKAVELMRGGLTR